MEEKHQAKWGERSTELILAPGVPLSPNLHMSANPKALRTPSSWIFTKVSLHKYDCLDQWSLATDSSSSFFPFASFSSHSPFLFFFFFLEGGSFQFIACKSYTSSSQKQTPNGYIIQAVRFLNLWQGTERKFYSLQKQNPHLSFSQPKAFKTHELSSGHASQSLWRTGMCSCAGHPVAELLLHILAVQLQYQCRQTSSSLS